MIKKIIFFILVFTTYTNCSFDTKSGIWTHNEKIKKEIKNKKSQILFEENKPDPKEFNKNLNINTPLKIVFNKNYRKDNNIGPFLISNNFTKKSKYKFSKIKDFENFSPELVFDNNNIIFFDKKGSIIKFNDSSKIIWKKNYYTKKEKKILPILNLSTNGKILIVTDSLSKYYALNLTTGEILWTKEHNALLNSEIKIDKDKFFIIDSENTINCFLVKDGTKLWEFKTDKDLIKSQQKLSIVLDNNKVYVNNSLGDIYSLDKKSGALVWLTPIRKLNNSSKSFLFKASKLVLDDTSLYLSNNQNLFYSINIKSGLVNWTHDINSYYAPIISNNLIFTISLDGYLFIIEKINGNIVRINDLFANLSDKKRKKLKISGFALSTKNIYVSLNNGKILEVSIKDAELKSTLKIGGKNISKPFISNQKMYIIKNNEVVKLD